MSRTSEEVAALSEFGRRVAVLRRERGLSQERLAELSRLDRTHIGTIEREQPNVSLCNLLRLARALEVEPAQLVKGLRLPAR